VLDFVFVSGTAQQLVQFIQHPVPEPSYCSNEASRSDYKPVLGAFELGAPRPAATKEQLLERLESIQRELDSLKRLIESL
jgi:hypothetical protein